MTEHQYIVLFNRWFLGISNVVANYIMITTYGFVGAAVASALTLALVNLLRLLEIWVLERYYPYTRRFLKPIVATIIVAASIGLIRSELLSYGVSGIVLLVSGGVIGTSIYLSVIYSLGIDRIDYEIYQELRGKSE
jgi:O-antigen/teichoic acid export membrane protein